MATRLAMVTHTRKYNLVDIAHYVHEHEEELRILKWEVECEMKGEYDKVICPIRNFKRNF